MAWAETIRYKQSQKFDEYEKALSTESADIIAKCRSEKKIPEEKEYLILRKWVFRHIHAAWWIDHKDSSLRGLWNLWIEKMEQKGLASFLES